MAGVSKAFTGVKRHNIRRIIGATLIVASVGLAAIVYGRLYLKRWVWSAQVDRAAATGADPFSFLAAPLGVPAATTQTPVSESFGLVIAKLNVNVPVVKNVSGTIGKEYYAKLRDGVAHQAGTPTPDKGGNTVIFGHSSSVPGVQSAPYDEAFLLLDKLKPGDALTVFYNKQPYSYTVQTVTKVGAGDVQIVDNTPNNQVTLYTCWPPGTNVERLAVVATR